MQIKAKKNLNHFSAACSESRHFAPLAALSRSFHGDGETSVSAATRTKRLQLRPTTLPGGINTPRNTRISSDSGFIVSFSFLKPAPTVPLFGLHCVRMLRRKTEVKAQGFTLKAAMRNSVVSHSIRARDGLDYMDFVSDLIYSVCFVGWPGSVVCGQKDAFKACRKYLYLVGFKPNNNMNNWSLCCANLHVYSAWISNILHFYYSKLEASLSVGLHSHTRRLKVLLRHENINSMTLKW